MIILRHLDQVVITAEKFLVFLNSFIIFFEDDVINSEIWDTIQKEMSQIDDADPSQSWVDEFSSYYNTGQKVSAQNIYAECTSIDSENKRTILCNILLNS